MESTSIELKVEGVDAIFVENSASIFNSDEEAEKASKKKSKKSSKKIVAPPILVADAGEEKIDDQTNS